MQTIQDHGCPPHSQRNTQQQWQSRFTASLFGSKQLLSWACGSAALNKSNFSLASLSHWCNFHWIVKNSFWFTPMKVNMGSDPTYRLSVFVPALQEAASIQYPIQFAKWTWNPPEHSSVQGTDFAYRPLKKACDIGTVCGSPSLICDAAFQTKLLFPLRC